MLYGLAEGLRVVSVLLHPYMPDTTTRLLEALGQDDVSLERATFGARPGRRDGRQAAAAVPEGRAGDAGRVAP